MSRQNHPSETHQLRTHQGLFGLLALPGVGTKTATTLATRFESWDQVRDTDPVDLAKMVGGQAKARAIQQLRLPDIPIPEAPDVRPVGLFDNDYPAGLRDLNDPPPLIFVRGQLPAADAQMATVVGTRHPSVWGTQVTTQVAQNCVNTGWHVISGLAFGIDTIAHTAALEAGGITHAVLPGGVDKPDPVTNRELAERIVEAGGVLLSEKPPGHRPTRSEFVQRDRLQSALADIVIITECGLRSGALHAAKHALLLNIPLAVPKPRPGFSEGTHALTLSPPDPTVLPGITIKIGAQLRERHALADQVIDPTRPLAGQMSSPRLRSPDATDPLDISRSQLQSRGTDPESSKPAPPT